MKKSLVFACLPAIVFGLIAFQNCGQSNTTTPEVSSGSPSNSVLANLGNSESQSGSVRGNGDGYEGKIFASKDPKLCGEENSVFRRIIKKGDGYYITRDKCHDVAPAPVTIDASSSSPAAPKILVVENSIFEADDFKAPNTDIKSQTFKSPGDSFIYAICRSEITRYGPPYGYADGVIRVIKTQDTKPILQGEFYTYVPDANAKKLPEVGPHGPSHGMPMIRKNYYGDVRLVTEGLAPRIAMSFRMSYLYGVAERLERFFILNFLRDPKYGYNGTMQVPNNSENGFFWTPSLCNKVSEDLP